MKTYSEKEGTKPFDWFKVLNKSFIDWVELSELSSSWVTCACGNQCSIIPRNKEGEPIDLKLFQLGVDFHSAILNHNNYNALLILEEIESRSDELIKEISCESK